MELSLQTMSVATDDGSEGGLLVLHGGVLVAVLVCLDHLEYGSDQGHWHLEVGFGRCSTRPTTFHKLENALRWVAERLGLDPAEGSACALAYVAHAGGHSNY